MKKADLFQFKIPSTINIKSKYIKSLRINNLYFQPKAKRKPESKKNLEKYIHNKLIKSYFKSPNFYNIQKINEIISNQKSHIVSEFKDYLIKDDYSEFFWKFYSKKESNQFLAKILNYYKQTSVVFPNYILLTENKYLYKNIQRKQKLINILEEKEEKCLSKCKKIGYDTDDFFDIYSKVFNSKILDSILNESESSQLKKSLFGVSTENSNLTDTDNKMNNLVNNITKIEENCRQEFLFRKKLINNEIKISKKDNILNNNSTSSKSINVNNNNKFNNKNVIISRNRHKSVEISKYSKFTKDESKFKNNKNKAKTTNPKDIKNNSIFLKIIKQRNKKGNNSFVIKNDSNKNIIFNNIYTTDLYLNINNNIIIKEPKNKSHDKKNFKNIFKNVLNKLDLKKLKNLGISRDSLNLDLRKNKHLKKNYINNILLSINSVDKESCKYSQKSESEREYKNNKSKKNISERERHSYLDIMYNKSMNYKKNKIHEIIKTLNKSKDNTSRTYYKKEKQISMNLESKKHNKKMLNQFKNSLNNLMNSIYKKNDEINIKIKNYTFRNDKNGYSNRFSSFINKKPKNLIESYNDSIKSMNNKSIKTKRKTNKINSIINKANLTSRSYISEKNKLTHDLQNNYNKKKKRNDLNIKNMKKEFNSAHRISTTKNIKNDKRYLIGELISLNKYNHRKKNEFFSLTSRESNKNLRNRNNKKSKINYTSFIKSNNKRFKAFQNPLNPVNLNYILYKRPKSLPNKKENTKIKIDNKDNIIKSNKIDYNKNMRKNSMDKSLKEKIEKLNKTYRLNRRGFQKNNKTLKNTSQVYSSLSQNNLSTNKNINININNISKINKTKIDVQKVKEIQQYINKNIEKQNSNKIIEHKLRKYKSTFSDKINKNKKINYSQIELRNKNYKDIYNDRKKYNNIKNNINNNKNKQTPSFYTDRIYQKK